MDITFFHWAHGSDSSIKRSFKPLISELKKNNNVSEYSVPYLGANPLNVIKNIWFVYKHRNKKGINHVTGDIHYCILGLIGVRTVLTIHDDYAYSQAKRGILDKLYKYLFWLYFPIKIADRVTCISPETKYQIDRLVKNKKTQLLPQHSLDDKYKAYPRSKNEKPILLQIGTAPQKNLARTMHAIQGLNVQLHVIRPMTDKQIALAESLNIDYINLYDLSDDEIIEEYIKADIVLFPSLKEGFGMPVIEAQSMGRPVITSNIQPMTWVAGDDYPLLINPLSEDELRICITNLLNDRRLYERAVGIGKTNVCRFSTRSVAGNFQKLYNDLQDGHK